MFQKVLFYVMARVAKRIEHSDRLNANTAQSA